MRERRINARYCASAARERVKGFESSGGGRLLGQGSERVVCVCVCAGDGKRDTCCKHARICRITSLRGHTDLLYTTSFCRSLETLHISNVSRQTVLVASCYLFFFSLSFFHKSSRQKESFHLGKLRDHLFPFSLAPSFIFTCDDKACGAIASREEVILASTAAESTDKRGRN